MAKKKVEKIDKVAVITVHGTNDSAEDPNGSAKWWQTGSDFTKRLQARLSARGVNADVLPFIWSGANSAIAREKAALDLVKDITDKGGRYECVHVIGHSHGGNVANEALCRLRLPEVLRALIPFGKMWIAGARAQVASLTTVGTPFFRAQVRAVNSFSPWAAYALALLGVLGTLFVGGTSILILWSFAEEHPVLRILFAIPLLCIAASLFLFRFAFEEQVLRTRLQLTSLYQRYKDAALINVHAIWHPNDEAISFLQRVETMEIEALGRGALLGRSRRNAIVTGIRFGIWTIAALMISGIVGAITFITLSGTGTRLPFSWSPPPNDLLMWGILSPFATFAAGALFAPVFFGGVYFGYRLLFGVVPEWRRAMLNKFVQSALTGAAFGRDGVEEIGSVSPRSHTFETQEVVLDGDIAKRMQDGADGAANRLIEKYRWALFTVGADTNSSLTQMAADAMTWDSLIHTTYFDQPEISDLIADHIVEKCGAGAPAQSLAPAPALQAVPQPA